MFLLFYLLLQTAHTPPAYADACPSGKPGECSAEGNNGYGIRDSDFCYAEIDGQLRWGRALHAAPDGSVLFRPYGQPKLAPRVLPPAAFAIAKDANCLEVNSPYCVGRTTERTESGVLQRGMLRAFFPLSGHLVIEENGKLLKVPATKVSTHPSWDHGSPPNHDWQGRIRASLRDFAALSGLNLIQASANCYTGAPSAPVNPALARTSLEAGQNSRLELSQLLHTWDPAPASDRGNPWAGCENPAAFGRYLKTDSEGYLSRDCSPDTLFTWGPLWRLKILERRMGNGSWSQNIAFGSRPLFFARTPAATFGFGSGDESGGYGARMKLKPGVRIKYLGLNADPPDCKKIPQAEQDSTVYLRILGGVDDARNFGNYSAEDFMLCSSAPIESWSYGTKGFYDELVRDLRLATSDRRKEWPGYVQYQTPNSQNAHLLDLNADRHPFTQTQLLNTMKHQLRLSESDSGRLFVNPNAEEGAASRHYQSSNPAWFHR